MKRTIHFGNGKDVTPAGGDLERFSFDFTVVDSALIGTPEEEAATEHHRVIASVSDVREGTWNLASRDDLRKVLFEYAQRFVCELVENGKLDKDQNTVERPMLTSSNSPDACQFNPAKIKGPDGFHREVEVRNRPIGFGPSA